MRPLHQFLKIPHILSQLLFLELVLGLVTIMVAQASLL